MFEDKELLRVAEEWARRADDDLKVAAHTLTLGTDCPTEIVCFHAQQCTEKYLKAVLVLWKIDPPKSHDLSRLSALLPQEARPALSAEEAARLTDYAATARYPGDYEEITLSQAKQAVALSRRVRREMRRHFPKRRARE